MVYSKIGSDGKITVDCTECVYGYNGSQECSWDVDRPKRRGCQSGEVLPEIREKMEAMGYGAQKD